MRIRTLSPNTRHGLLAVGLFLIGLSTALGVGVPETGEDVRDVARFPVTVTLEEHEDCNAQG